MFTTHLMPPVRRNGLNIIRGKYYWISLRLNFNFIIAGEGMAKCRYILVHCFPLEREAAICPIAC